VDVSIRDRAGGFQYRRTQNGIVARATVARIRTTLKGLADQFQTLPPYDVEGGASAVEVPVAPDAPQGESKLVTRIEDSSYDDVHPESTGAGALHLAETLHLPEIDGATDSTLHIYWRTDRVMGSRWGHDKKFFNIDVLTTGNDPSYLAERLQYANNQLSPADLQSLVTNAAAAGVDLTSMLRDIDAHVVRQEQEAKDAASFLAEMKRRLRKAAASKQKTFAELAKLAEFRAWALPLFEAAGRERDLDAVLGATLGGPKPSGQ
jgi:hypothetical protein